MVALSFNVQYNVFIANINLTIADKEIYKKSS